MTNSTCNMCVIPLVFGVVACAIYMYIREDALYSIAQSGIEDSIGTLTRPAITFTNVDWKAEISRSHASLFDGRVYKGEEVIASGIFGFAQDGREMLTLDSDFAWLETPLQWSSPKYGEPASKRWNLRSGEKIWISGRFFSESRVILVGDVVKSDGVQGELARPN